MRMGAWRTCPECGKKCLGYSAFDAHKALHAGLKEQEKVEASKGGIARIEERLKEVADYKQALALPGLPPLTRELVTRELEEKQKWGPEAMLEIERKYLAKAEAELSRVLAGKEK